jgi:hypothetical protein
VKHANGITVPEEERDPVASTVPVWEFPFVLSTWMEMVCCTTAAATAAAAPNLTAKALSSPSFFPKASPFLLR